MNQLAPESSNRRIGWLEMLDILTDSNGRRKERPFNSSSDFEKVIMFLLQHEGWRVQPTSLNNKIFDFELQQNGLSVAVQARNHKYKVHIEQLEKFLDYLSQPEGNRFTSGFIISAAGFSQSVYSYLRAEGINNLRLGVFDNGSILWDDVKLYTPKTNKKATYIGVFTCKGGVGKTTVSTHLAGAFALNGYDVVLVDLDRQSNLRKLLGGEVYLPQTNGATGSNITVLNHSEWNDEANKENKIVICDCNPEFSSNPLDFIRKFDYCLVPTTLNPLGINKNADVIKRTFLEIRRVNQKAELFVLINNYHSDEATRNVTLNSMLREQFRTLTDNDPKCHYIDPENVAIRFSKHLWYWGYHLVDNASPQLAFRSIGGKSYPRTDFLKLVDYLENHTEIEKLKTIPVV